MFRWSRAWLSSACCVLAGVACPLFAATTVPPSVAFGGQSMATTSPPQAVTFTNDGGASITVSNVSVSNGQFAQTNNCTTVAPSASCTINVTFTPAVAAGALNSTVAVNANLTITSSAASSPNTAPLSGTAEKSLVTHFYRSILRRAPDAPGKAFWEGEAVRVSGLGANVNEVWFAMSTFFFFSAEYTSFNRNSAQFVTDLYNTFFNRPPDSGGLTFWSGQLASGMPREVVLVSFLFSTEFTTLTANIFGNTATRAEVDVVGDFFRGLLARLPDDGGFTFWVNQFRTAQCAGGPGPVYTQIESISSSFANGSEYTSKNRTNAEYVGDLYNAFLRRGGDLNGVNYWVSRLDSAAMTRNQVRQQFIASSEFTARINAIIAQGCLGKTYYLSPSGNNANTGTAPGSPWKTFAKAFGAMSPGDELVLLDGSYGTAAGTGYIDYQNTPSAQPKSGTALTSMTVVRAQNPGNVTINGGLFLGRVNRKDSYIRIQGITFVGYSELYNADYVTLKDCGFNGGFGIGTNDHDMFSDHNLIEDVWIWASGQRVIAINYRSHYNVWRRVVIRGDGCSTSSCLGGPNVGITVYDSNNISYQNIMVVDRILSPGAYAYGDFAVAQHTPDPRYYFGQSEWLGVMSIKAPDAGFMMEPDVGSTIDPSIKIQNAVVWEAAIDGMNLDREGTNNLLENLTVNTKGLDPVSNGIRVGDGLTSGTLRNAIVTGTGKYGVNSVYPPSRMDVFFTATGSVYSGNACTTQCLTTNPRADTPGPSLKHVTRIEAGSKLKGAGLSGADIGANVVYRYGLDGSRFGEGGYNTLSSAPLWPWPNEARIKAEMCAGTTRGFCATGTRLDGVNPVTLTSYVWELLNNPIPAGIYPP